MSEQPELLPCPFCCEGVTLEVESEGYFHIACRNDGCPIRPCTSWSTNRDAIIAEWHTRVIKTFGELVAWVRAQKASEE